MIGLYKGYEGIPTYSFWILDVMKGWEGLSGSAPFFDISIIILLLEKLLVEKFDF